ncbi:MFS transporter [Aeromicrobium sp. YIM 150415]|uniref:MFS transporter n=1 Tax=Aeromicrobium sp. YIM 150415 TaxID=2803912 RepID=UPI001965DF4A|nr:MFS transporter [Aeromicrobium sp. YIM 150415]MBM9461981.1 MFS transporter [Aeromicrobium sp. YIM 150415]
MLSRRARSRRGPSTFASLRTPNYRIYAGGALVSNIGTWLQRIAQDWLILALTGSGTMLGICTGLQLLPSLLLTPWAGAIADRWPRRRILRYTQIAMALPSLVLGTMAVTGRAETWHVLVLVVVFGTAAAVDAPARQSFATELVAPHHIANAVALNSASMHSARLIGPAIAGLLIAALGGGIRATGWVIVINAASYGAMLAALWAIDPARLHRSGPLSQGQRAGVREGLDYVRSRPDLLFLLGCALVVGVAGQAFQTLSPLMVTEVYQLGPKEYGMAATAAAIGSLAGALAVARFGGLRLGGVAAAGFAFGVLQIIAALMPGYLAFVLVLPFLGLSSLAMITAANATIQTTSEPRMRGRAVAAFLMVLMGGAPIGAPVLGWLAEETDPRIAMLAGGSLTLAIMALATAGYARSRAQPPERSLDLHRDPPPHPPTRKDPR